MIIFIFYSRGCESYMSFVMCVMVESYQSYTKGICKEAKKPQWEKPQIFILRLRSRNETIVTQLDVFLRQIVRVQQIGLSGLYSVEQMQLQT